MNHSINVNHHTQNSPIGGVAVFIELVEMDGVVRGIDIRHVHLSTSVMRYALCVMRYALCVMSYEL
jgi:hypothetical protein